MRLLSIESDPKTSKSVKLGYLTGICYMAPAESAGAGSVCPWSTAECRSACLAWFAGRGHQTTVRAARIRRTLAWFQDRDAWMQWFRADVTRLEARARRRSLRPVVRANGASDCIYPEQGLAQEHPSVRWMDYTKSAARAQRSLKDASWPENYHLTLSWSGHNSEACEAFLRVGGTVAVPFVGEFPDMWRGFRVVDGDAHDCRFLDPMGVVVGLRAKGGRGNVHRGRDFFQRGA